MANNITMRDALFTKLYEMAKDDKDIVIISVDMGAPALDKFRRDFPGRYINAGVAEQNALLIAAGLALSGKKVFVYSIASFITLRCYEQIRTVLCSMKIPVTIVGVGTGFGYDDSGPTHHSVEDISIMRVLPNMTVNCPSDNTMVSAFADSSLMMKGPNYIRLERQPLDIIYNERSDFSKGFSILKPVRDICLVATGNMVHRALEAAEELKRSENIEIGVVDVFTLPTESAHFLNEVGNAKTLVTLEEHTIPGGLGSYMCELVMDNEINVQIKRLGLDLSNGYCYKYGGRDNIQAMYGLDKEAVVKYLICLNNR